MRERIRIKRDSIHDANEDKENPEGFDEIGDLLVVPLFSFYDIASFFTTYCYFCARRIKNFVHLRNKIKLKAVPVAILRKSLNRAIL